MSLSPSRASSTTRLTKEAMTRQFKYLFRAFGLVSVSILAYYLWYYAEIIKAHRFLTELEARMAADPTIRIPYKKARSACHTILRDRNWGNHDAFMLLTLVGNHESIPYLLKALKWEDPPSENGGASCSTFHCVGALEKTTGRNFGLRYEPWEIWWREEGSKLPPDVIEANASNHWMQVISKRHVETLHPDSNRSNFD